MTAVDFIPFADDANVANVGGLSVENGEDSILVHGSLVIAKDKQTLERVRNLVSFLDQVVKRLGDIEGLPEVAETTAPIVVEIDNPFA